MKFRPCIDIHDGKVKQIVGSSLTDDSAVENFVSKKGGADFATLYKDNNLKGGHIIILNKIGTKEYEESKLQAISALSAYPDGLQIGGGITADNAKEFIDKGASHVIVTSYVFKDGQINFSNLDALKNAVGKEHILRLQKKQVPAQQQLVELTVLLIMAATDMRWYSKNLANNHKEDINLLQRIRED